MRIPPAFLVRLARSLREGSASSPPFWGLVVGANPECLLGRILVEYRLPIFEKGLELEHSVRAAPRFEEAGLDYLHLSSGCYQALKWTFPEREGLMLTEAKAFKRVLDIPVVCSNMHDPRHCGKGHP